MIRDVLGFDCPRGLRSKLVGEGRIGSRGWANRAGACWDPPKRGCQSYPTRLPTLRENDTDGQGCLPCVYAQGA